MKKFRLALLAVVPLIVLLAGAPPLAYADNNMPAASSNGTVSDNATDNTTDTTNDKANNTGINARDRHGATRTPMDQSSSQADTDVTARIRKALIADHTLSTSAKNVKIITENDQVTLRGPVKNEMERTKVFSAAKQHAPGKKIVNELEILAP